MFTLSSESLFETKGQSIKIITLKVHVYFDEWNISVRMYKMEHSPGQLDLLYISQN